MRWKDKPECRSKFGEVFSSPFGSVAQLAEREAYTFCMHQISARLGVRLPPLLLLAPLAIWRMHRTHNSAKVGSIPSRSIGLQQGAC